ncbi:MAG: radical SAM protein [Elusimicrobiota bacterium]|jgi:hypothetical protein
MDAARPLEDPLDNTCNMTLLLTRACQLACAYCRMDRNPASSMEEPVLRRAVDLLMSGPSPSVALDFSGGEPLLRFELIRRGILYATRSARSRGKSLRLDLSTNGLLLDEGKAAFLLRRGVRIHVSSDGSLRTHARNRPPARGPARSAAERCRAALSLLARLRAPFDATMVVFPEDVPVMARNARHLMDAGASVVQIDYALGVTWSREQASDLAEGLGACVLEARRRRALGAQVAVESSCFGNPDLNSALMAIDTDGTILMGCTPTVEATCPTLAGILRFGSVYARRNLQGLRRTPSEMARFILSSLRPERERRLFVNNLAVGLAVRAALASRGLAPVPSGAPRTQRPSAGAPSRPARWTGRPVERWILGELAALEEELGSMPSRGAWDGPGPTGSAGGRTSA